MKPRRLCLCLLSFAVVGLWIIQVSPRMAMAAGASGSGSSSGSAASASSQAHVDDDMIRKAAGVFPKIQRIAEEAGQAVQRTSDQGQQKQILSAARNRQLSALHDARITQQEYENVLVALNSNPDVKAKFESYIRGSQGS